MKCWSNFFTVECWCFLLQCYLDYWTPVIEKLNIWTYISWYWLSVNQITCSYIDCLDIGCPDIEYLDIESCQRYGMIFKHFLTGLRHLVIKAKRSGESCFLMLWYPDVWLSLSHCNLFQVLPMYLIIYCGLEIRILANAFVTKHDWILKKYSKYVNTCITRIYSHTRGLASQIQTRLDYYSNSLRRVLA